MNIDSSSTDQYPTRGQLERKLSQSIQAFYRKNLGYQPGHTICHLFEKKLAIIIENSVTPTEQFLTEEGQGPLAKQVRDSLDNLTRSRLQQLIEDILGVEVKDLLSDVTLETGRMGIIAVLEGCPKVRNPESIQKKNPN
ncbi:unknown [Crocosphaera subtropica ATCC 51142]|uniref:Na+-translocating membrane potential-generating system MpsC domain-containing protein n=1 Tax=Crocosphaera subtropica (strain ATCC 51142 / BH68) TaxID=43989 RepID=B1WRK5_CROS5|nr:DUF2294 domain-containing protein [Crocosphaera subtropica]ACB51854.1 unknown [Crocosphaera subtropica ATCC 51142]